MKNKKGEFMVWVLGIFLTFSSISMIFIWVVVPYISTTELGEFCQEEGYDWGNYAQTIFQKSYCIKEEDNSIIKTEVDRCKNEWCLVKSSSEEILGN